jgi:hypothetical protein
MMHGQKNIKSQRLVFITEIAIFIVQYKLDLQIKQIRFPP